MTQRPLPQLVAPAGNFEKLKLAVFYGADAAYISGQQFGLRAAADNFSLDQIEQAANFMRNNKKQLYVVTNAFVRDFELRELYDFIQRLEDLGVSAIVVSDLGVITTARRAANLPIFLSTQASCLNSSAASLWKSLGVSRIILGREVSIKEAQLIKQRSKIAVEMFVHGALCMAYSGHCTLSNYLANRDANRGGCIHLCRHCYQTGLIGSQEESRFTQQMNRFPAVVANTFSSKDLAALPFLAQFYDASIDALKIEGRMRSALYLATVCRVYRRALDTLEKNRLDQTVLAELYQELNCFPNRGYCSGWLTTPAGQNTLYWETPTPKVRSCFAATVIDRTDDKLALRLYSPLAIGDQLSFLPFSGPIKTTKITKIVSLSGQCLSQARQEEVVYLPINQEIAGVETYNVVRAIRQ